MRRQRFEDNLDQGAIERLHELDKAAGAIIAAELAKEDCDPGYALSVKKTVQLNMKGPRQNANAAQFTQNIIDARSNTQINQTVLERARRKMLRIEDQVKDDLQIDDTLLATA
jgi:hypothetical protein